MNMAGKRKRVLHSGDFCFEQADACIHTLLGSCVSITAWHPRWKIGGMCHFALSRPAPRPAGQRPDARYAEDCIELFKSSARRVGTDIHEYRMKIFGGGNMRESASTDQGSIGERNAATAFSLLMEEGLAIDVAHVGEFGHRKLIFDVATGDVWVRFEQRSTVGDVSSLNGRI